MPPSLPIRLGGILGFISNNEPELGVFYGYAVSTFYGGYGTQSWVWGAAFA